MVQLIITMLIVLLAVAGAVLLAVKKVRKLKKPDPCRDCKASCGDCALYPEIHKRRK